MALSPLCRLILPSWLETVDLLLMCLRKFPNWFFVYSILLYFLFFLVIWHWTVVKALACSDSSTYTVKCWGKMACLCCIGRTTDGRDCRHEERRCWRTEGLYLYINIHTPVYYPVNYVEIGRCRDVFFGFKKGRGTCNKDRMGALCSELWEQEEPQLSVFGLKVLLITTRQM